MHLSEYRIARTRTQWLKARDLARIVICAQADIKDLDKVTVCRVPGVEWKEHFDAGRPAS
jgi:hypothetical protein